MHKTVLYFRFIKYIYDLVQVGIGIQRYQYAPDLLHGKIGNDPFRAAVADNTYLFAGFCTL
ncbi:hypothetical protein D9M68_852000 [compost metagenome]